jgi:hypothetical protein
VITQTVDGGYFSNAGFDSLAAIIPELRKQHLRPLVISIDSSAVKVRGPGMTWMLPGRFTTAVSSILFKPQRDLFARLGIFFGALAEPLLAVNAVRTARGDDAAAGFADVIGPNDFFRPEVFASPGPGASNPWCIGQPTIPVVEGDAPVSWWLSPVAQRFLDVQLCASQNEAAMSLILKRLRLVPVYK